MSEVDTGRVDAARRRLLEQRLRSGPAPHPTPAPPSRGDAAGPAALSVSQAQLWFHMQVNPASTAYNEVVTIDKRGDLDIVAFRRAFNQFLARHESWRTGFRVMAGEPVQVVVPPQDHDLPVIDLTGLPIADAEARATAMVADDTRRPYDLGSGRLVRPRLVRFAADHHRLYLGLHHLIFDGVTLYRVLLPELVALYDAAAEGRRSPLPDPAVQYADYARWERWWVDGPEIAARLERWRERLRDVQPLDLPLDRPRPSRPRFSGGMVPLTLDAETTGRLRTVARGAQATLFQVLAAGYAWWLHRYDGHDRVAFATMCDLRQRDQLAMLAGYCLSPVVLRADLSNDPTLVDLVRAMREEVVDAVDDVVPFERLVRELGVPRDARRNPLFQATLVLEPAVPSPDPQWSIHLMGTEIGNAVGQSKFDLGVEFDERPEGHLAGRLMYDGELFERGSAEQMAQHLTRLLAVLAEQPERPVAELDQGGADVAADPATPRAPVAPVHEVIAMQTAGQPDAVAVVAGADSVCYGELLRRARAVAGGLAAAGVGRGALVALYLERTAELVTGLLATLLAGAGYLPLDPRQPVARTRFMLDDAAPAAILSCEGLCASEALAGVPVLTVERLASTVAPPPLPPVRGDDIAYLMYTSGSTGRPKGVLVAHHSLSRLATTLLPRIGVRAGDTVLSVASYAFDMSVGDIFGALAQGATLVLADAEQAGDPRQLAALVERHTPTLLSATPTTWQALLDSGWAGAPTMTASSGGEPLPPELAAALLERCAGLWNCYGPTETTDVVCCGPVRADEAISVGRPLDGVRLYILDRVGRRAPAGVPGEVVIGGDFVAAGYLNRPEETARSFGDDPHVPGGRIYRTGDRGRLLAGGRLRHLGRYDEQVKVRGFRIEPGEVESALRSHPDVTAAAVVARPSDTGAPELVAYVVADRQERDLDDVALRSWLRSRLPDYMIPGVVMAVPRLPQTPGGKLDRAALPDPSASPHRPPPSAGRAATTDTQQRLATLWSELLSRDVTDVGADFFDLGGHSLLAARLIVEVQQRFGVVVSLADFLERGTTVAGSAALIDAVAAGSGDRAPPPSDVPTLFVVYPDLPAAVSLRHLTGRWGEQQPAQPLLPRQRFGRFDRAGGVERLAAPLLATIRERQPRGPYRLAGFSFGGLIAYDIARSLLADGERVEWLGLMDALAPVVARRMPRTDPLRVRFIRHLRRSRSERALKYARFARRPVLAAGLPSPELAGDESFDYRGALVIGSRYRRSGLAIPVELFATDDSVRESGSETLGWQEFHRGPLTVHRFSGNHSTLLDLPDAQRLADLVLAGAPSGVPG